MPHELDFSDLSATSSFVASGLSQFEATVLSSSLDETADGIEPHDGSIPRPDTASPAAGVSLDVWLQQQPHGLAWRRTSDVVTAVSDLLAAAHARGICHGAICPEAIRIIVGDNPAQETWTLDITGDASLDAVRLSKFARPCQSPEQIQGRLPIDPRSDVYALGVVLYRMLCNRYPFRAADPKDLQREIVEDAPQPPRQLAHGVPVELE